MRCTIFGAAGFIGSRLAQRLREAGHEVLCPSRSASPDDGPEHGWGHVFWAAGLTADFRSRPFDAIRAHVGAMMPVLERSRFESFLYLSSTRIYQHDSDTSESASVTVDPANGSDLYNISKLAGEAICLSSGSPTVRIARLSNVVGPREADRQTFIGALCREAATGVIRLETARASEKDYIWVDDAVRLLVAIGLGGRSRIYNVASGRQTSHGRWAAALAEATGARIEVPCDAPNGGFPAINVSRIRTECDLIPIDPLARIEDIAGADIRRPHRTS